MNETLSLIEALKISNLTESSGVIESYNSGLKFGVSEQLVSSQKESLSKTYRIRLSNIKSKPGAHAQRLAVSVEEFVGHLEALDPVLLKTARISAQEVGSYLIWFIPTSYQIIGCMYLISQSDVGAEELSRIWNGT